MNGSLRQRTLDQPWLDAGGLLAPIILPPGRRRHRAAAAQRPHPVPACSPACCHPPLSPYPSTPYPVPMNTHTPPTAPHLPPRSPRPQAEGAPLLGRLCRLALPPCPPQGVGAGLAALFPFVDFGPFSTEAVGPRLARALADTTCCPFPTVSTPLSGALGPSSAPCLADTTYLPLSTCPSRLNPKLRRVPPGTGRTENCAHTIPLKSNPPAEGVGLRGWGGPGPARPLG